MIVPTVDTAVAIFCQKGRAEVQKSFPEGDSVKCDKVNTVFRNFTNNWHIVVQRCQFSGPFHKKSSGPSSGYGPGR